jgi:acetate---CoA ligase (ADP-forming)
MRKTIEAIDDILHAQSIAVVGASTDPRKFGYMTLRSLIEGGYEGRLFPINPKGGEILGLRAYPSISDIPGKLDLAVIIVPAKFVPGVLTEAAEKGARGAAILSGGFREAGRPDLEKEIADVCVQKGIRLMGPNIQGINYLPNKLCAMFFPVIKTRGPIAIISQSGTHTAALSEWAAGEGLGISAAINLGNQVDICESDYLEFFAHEENTRAIVMYLEGVKDGEKFLNAIKHVGTEKPIAILKGGKTTAGQKSAASHTGSLAGKHEVFAAACRQYGLFCASDLEDLFDGAKALSTLHPLRGNRVMAISTSGGIGVLAADGMESSGLGFPPLSQDLINKLKTSDMPPLAVFSNPLDLVSIEAEYFERAVLAADSMNFADVFLLGFGDPVAGGAEMVKKLSSKIKAKLAVVYLGGGDTERKHRVEIQSAGIPVFPSPQRAMRALSVAFKTSSCIERRKQTVESSGGKLPPRPVQEKKPNAGRFILEPDAVRYLKEFGISYPEHGIATNHMEAVRIADRLGYPVVLKIVSPNASHKSDIGGVTVGLKEPREVLAAYDQMISRIKRENPSISIAGVMVCKQVDGGVEVIVGALNDAVFGPTIMFGLGGIYTEVYKDVTFRIAPIDHADAEEMVKEIRGYPMLSGVRGHPGYDVEGLLNLLVSVSHMVWERSVIQELDLNPVRVLERGVTALDVRILEKEHPAS